VLCHLFQHPEWPATAPSCSRRRVWRGRSAHRRTERRRGGRAPL